MATIVFSAVGAALGASVGGSVLGLSSLVIGRAIGATVGRVIDARILGAGSDPVETGKVDRFRLSGASEGAAVPHVMGAMRVPGQVIWASDFLEGTRTSGGGKGTPKPKVTEYSYSVSVALALCAGEILRVGRVWADGDEISASDLTMRVYTGTQDQLPDPRIEAVEGTGMVPAYRGVAYVVIEDLELAPFGNRVPQLSFEVIRPARPDARDEAETVWGGTRAVALIPGTGDYALASTPVYGAGALGGGTAFNVNAPGEGTDLIQSLNTLGEEVPNCGSVSLVVSWFGDDLRCSDCQVRPMVEQKDVEGEQMPWTVSGLSRETAQLIGQAEGRPVYGSTPSDQSVIEAIKAIKATGKEVMFYPFLLMDVLAGNSKPDPWSDADTQPSLPWRGRITASTAPGRPGSPDRSAAVQGELDQFLGTAQPGDFMPASDTVGFGGAAQWSYRRFILHYAHLCALAGGVEAFCVGSEMRSLTQLRDGAGQFPMVAALRTLAADVRTILGPETKISYAADWSEYFGYHPQDGSGDVLFHLDPLWADTNIDFIGIDNYMPLSDWRDGEDHQDAHWGSGHERAYLAANVEGGEGYDWYYPTKAARDLQLRQPIRDEAEGEDWVFRYKDMRSWWSLPHHERIGGQRQSVATGWEPRSKPIWFTEIGCAAIDKGTNQPNVFLDAKSSESALPYYSSGHRDDLIQARYLEALYGYWGDAANNPYSEIYAGAMIDMTHAHVWAWDSRPYPQFPSNRELWSDGANHARGHWLSGRVGVQALGDVVAEICEANGVASFDVSRVQGSLRGYAFSSVETGRAALQPLMVAFGFDAVEREGTLVFRSRDAKRDHVVERTGLVRLEDDEVGEMTNTRQPNPETAGRVRVGYLQADANYEARVAETVLSDDPSLGVSHSDLSLVLSAGEARAISERWLAESRVARDTVSLVLPPSLIGVRAGEVIEIADGARGRFRIDRIEEAGARKVEAVRVEPDLYTPAPHSDDGVGVAPYVAPVPVFPLFMDLPLITGEEIPHAPHLAVSAQPWPGSAALYSSASDDGYSLNKVLGRRAVIGTTLDHLPGAQPGIWQRGANVRVRLGGGVLASASAAQVLDGANAIAIGAGSQGPWEVAQFTTATLVAPDTYELGGFLRGQLGTDSVMPDTWPAGSYVVALDGAPEQIDMQVSQRGFVRHYRVGPATRGYDDPSYRHEVLAFEGVGLRPLSPVHLRAARGGAGGLDLSWTRRTRIDGDSWQGLDVPLGEERERYLLRVMEDQTILREVELTLPSWHYSDAMQAQDGVAPSFTVAVAQLSDQFGAGPFRRILINV